MLITYKAQCRKIDLQDFSLPSAMQFEAPRKSCAIFQLLGLQVLQLLGEP